MQSLDGLYIHLGGVSKCGRTTNPKQPKGDDTIMYCAGDGNNDKDRHCNGNINHSSDDETTDINHSSDTNNETTNTNLILHQSNNSKNNEMSTRHTAKQTKIK